MKNTQHNFGLDLARAGAILAVLFNHTAEWWLGASRQTTIQSAFIGRAGVELFFSLSGFLIGGILLRAIEGGLGPAALRRFWTRRWMRTLPAYWVLIVALNAFFGTHDWRSLLFLQNFMPPAEWVKLASHTWSLVLEEWFYLIMPLLLMGALAVLGRRRAGWAAPLVCLTLIVACTTGRAVVGLEPSPVWGPDPMINPLLRLDCAAWGVLAAWLVRRRPMPRWIGLGFLLLGTALLVVLGQVWTMRFQAERLIPWGLEVWGNAYESVHYSAETLAAAFLVLGLHRLLPHGTGLVAGFAGATARLSYSLYLVHLPVIYLGRLYGLDDASSWAIRLLLMVLIVAAALAMRYAVELPALALRDRLAPERRDRPVSDAGATAGIPGR